MDSELTIVTIIDSNTKKSMKLQCKWGGANVQLLLNDGDSSWIGNFNVMDISGYVLEHLDLEKDQYFKTMKTALGTSSVDSGFSYTFENDKLSWAKSTRDISILYGTIHFTPVTPSSHGELVRSLLDSYSAVLEELAHSVASYNRLEKEYEDINSAFGNCCKIKNDLEEKMYARFAAVLNEKKAYVRRVTGQCPTENFGPQPSGKITAKPKPEALDSISLLELSSIVKRNKCVPDERPRKKQMIEPQPGPSRMRFNDF